MTNPASPHLSPSGLSALDRYLKERPLPIFRGIEKEGLRVDEQLDIAQSNHPAVLGHPLTHSRITTDYSEALLELITGVHASREAVLEELEQIHAFIQRHIAPELLWAGSMPCRLDGEQSIRIAEYGDSNTGKLKHVYRQGLGVRYGRIMQSIAGLHYNFSLDDAFWQSRQSAEGNIQALADYKSDQYFALIRNFRRHAWLLMYLFGASPALDQSFLSEHKAHTLEPFDSKGSLYKPHACSLRMGDLGYHNNAQSELNICFNTLQNFTTTLGAAIKTPYPDYEKIGLQRDGQYIQLNTNILQIENEYYSSVRPKRTAKAGERPTQALTARGVEYIEVRCMDLNPLLPLGIGKSEIDFLDVMLMHSLLSSSPFIDDPSCAELDRNFALTVDRGREPGLNLSRHGTPIGLQAWGQELMQEMNSVAEIMDQESGDQRYQLTVHAQAEKLNNPDLTPSAIVLANMRSENRSWLELSGKLSLHHQNTLSASATEAQNTMEQSFAEEARASFDMEKQRKASDEVDFDTFLTDYQR